MIIAILILLGLCFGSFVNALVWRLRQFELPKKKRAATDKELSIATGRSMCTHCKHTLAWYDLLPVVSWVSVGGKCRYCHKAIGRQYPVVEVATAVLFVTSYVFWPVGLTSHASVVLFIIWLVSLVGLVALAVYDIRWMLLPNKIVFPLMVLAALGAVYAAFIGPEPVHSLLMTTAAVAIGGGIFYVLFQLSEGKWIGGGDVKLGFVIGLLLGTPSLAFLMLFVSSLLGLCWSIPAMVSKHSRLSSKIPFGPFLIAGTIIVMLFGQPLIDWYMARFLYL